LAHILIKPTEVLSDEEALKKAEDLLARAKAGEDFAEMAKEHSDDIGTAQRGGDLGWSNLGTFVPEFEQAMLETAVGEFSKPVKTQFGWHILKIEGRRDEDVSDLVLRNRARNMIHERKYQEELEIWLQKTRDEAYVDIKS
jgi:peptidyl-prolyl cis-trans isomerase SurA